MLNTRLPPCAAHLSRGCLPARTAFNMAVSPSNPITMAELISHPFQVKLHILARSYGRRQRSILSLMTNIADPTSAPSMNGTTNWITSIGLCATAYPLPHQQSGLKPIPRSSLM